MRRYWWRTLLSAAALLLALGAWAVRPAAWLEVTDEADNVLLRHPVQEGGRWCLAWNHSVAGFTVRDCYRYLDGRMLLERSHLPDFAAGLDHIPGRGQLRSDGRGGYWVEAIDEPVAGNRYLLRVGGEAVQHRLLLGDHYFNLTEAAAGQRVQLRVQSP